MNIFNILVLLVLVVGSTTDCFSKEIIKIAYDPWCPHTCDKSSEIKGIYLDVLTEVFKDSKFGLEFVQINWSRAIEDTRKGVYNAVAGALKADAPDFKFPKFSINYQKSCFYVKNNDKWKFNGMESLKGKKVGSVQGYTYGEPFDSAVTKDYKDVLDPITGEDTSYRLIQKLALGRNDIIIEDESVVRFTMMKLVSEKKLQSDVIKQAGCLKATPLYFAVSPLDKNKEEILKIWDEGVKKIKSNGTLKSLFKKYGQ